MALRLLFSVTGAGSLLIAYGVAKAGNVAETMLFVGTAIVSVLCALDRR